MVAMPVTIPEKAGATAMYTTYVIAQTYVLSQHHLAASTFC
jgi:hypothetical protein